ncbi:MAG TPA: hypothetical protein VE988_02190 [Gemmataceae bacterium]|nr:hypothetical protein [Gemmataceae bacterium]
MSDPYWPPSPGSGEGDPPAGVPIILYIVVGGPLIIAAVICLGELLFR